MTDPDTRTLHQRQVLHVELTSELIAWAQTQGYKLTWGETYRTPAQAAANAASGAGIVHSLHIMRLAVDFQAFDAQGKYLADDSTGVYSAMGKYWKTLDPLCCWGGDFHSVDLDHFSVQFQGIK
jgi:hypothetical protein